MLTAKEILAQAKLIEQYNYLKYYYDAFTTKEECRPYKLSFLTFRNKFQKTDKDIIFEDTDFILECMQIRMKQIKEQLENEGIEL